MKKLSLVMTLIFTGILLCETTYAGLYIEPNLNYMISGKNKDNTPGGRDSDLSGLQYGARAGMSFTMFSFGVDYTLGKISADDDVTKVDLDTSELGAFARVGLPLLQVYAAYLFNAKADFTVGGTDGSYKGSGYKLGVGYTGLPFIAINLEYKVIKYDDGSFSPIDSDLSGILIGVSAPFTFL